MTNRILPYGRQSIDDNDVAAIAEALRSDWLTTGPGVGAFEEAVAAKVGAPHAVAVCNGTAALHAAYYALGVGPGDEVIAPSFTFLATTNAACFLGAKPVFADIDPETLNIDPAGIEALVTKDTKAITVVHFAGLPVDMPAIREVADRHGLAVIEDAAHALGASRDGELVGSCRWADLTTFSFHPVKHITTGEGGLITTRDPELYRRMLQFRNHGSERDPARMEKHEGPWYYEMHELGYNYRITDFQCALGMSQLKKLDGFVDTRRRLVEQYRSLLADHPLIGLQSEPDGCRSSYHLMVALIDFQRAGTDRTSLMTSLREEGILTQVHYIPVNRHPWYIRKHPSQTNATPKTDAAYTRCLSLPLYPAMTVADVQRVCNTLLDLLS